MTNTKLNWLIVVGLAIAFCSMEPAIVSAQRPSVAQIFQRLDNLEAEVAALGNQVAQLELENTSLQMEIVSLNQMIDDNTSQILTVEGLIPTGVNITNVETTAQYDTPVNFSVPAGKVIVGIDFPELGANGDQPFNGASGSSPGNLDDIRFRFAEIELSK